MLRYLTAGESHGECLTAIVEGLPSGLRIDVAKINKELKRRQMGFGRGGRMKIEEDKVEISSGLRGGKTIGSPIALLIRNKDWRKEEGVRITRPRPGHADLAGALKYGEKDIRNVLERASARETAIRVAVGGMAKALLREFRIEVASHVVEIGGIRAKVKDISLKEILRRKEKSQLSCCDKEAERKMVKKIKASRDAGDSLGGIFEVIVTNVPVGLGSFVHWDRKLDGRLAQAIMSIQAVKGVEIGLGFELARCPGSKVHDEIFYRGSEFYRKTNNAGGIEGGVSNGEDIILRAVMKPISTLQKPLRSVDIITKKPFEATVQRADVCAVPACAVVGEAVVAIELARAMQEKFGGDTLEEVRRNYRGYMRQLTSF